jgi:hypothetical protein
MGRSGSLPVRQVGRKQLDGTARRPQFRGHRLEPVGRPGDEHEIIATRCEETGERGTYARRAAGDESYTHAVRLRCSGGTGCLDRGSDGSKGLIS